MKLIIGLGNIGNEYKKTRHNVGFMCLDLFAAEHGLKLRKTRKYSYYECGSCLLIRPTTYMNLSGEAFLSAQSKHKGFNDVLVIMDDIDLPIGEVRIRPNGGDGGHNGLKSILEKAGTTEIRRIRIGIGRPEEGTARDHVLDEFSAKEKSVVNELLTSVAGWLEVYINTDINRLLDEYSQWKKNPIPSTEDGINRPKEDHK
jgi:peptidyl-tRNA hydrolase, PTH1 family